MASPIRSGTPAVCLLCTAAAMAFAQTPAGRQPASVEGSVTNGLTGEPLAKARVTLTLPDRAGKSGKEYGAVTAADGKFSWATVQAGTYYVSVSLRGFVAAASPTPTTGLDIQPGAAVRDVDLKMAPEAVISGRVLDAQGDPVERVRVTARSGESRDAVSTDDRGEFSFSRLSAGKYTLHATPQTDPSPAEIRTDGTQEEQYGSTWFPNSLSEKEATPVQALPGLQVSGIEIRLVPIPILRVGGVVGGVPAGAERVSVVAESSDGTEIKWIPVRNGKFTVWRMPPGKYTFLAEGRTMDGRSLKSVAVDVELADSNVDNIALGLIPEFDIGGQIQWDGQPPHAGQLQNGGLRLSETPLKGKITSDGAFRIPKVTVGRHALALEGMPENVYIKSVSLGTEEMPDLTLDLRGNPGDALVTVLLSAAGARIAGVVTDSQGPKADVSVYLAPDSPEAVIPRTAETAADGSYSFHGVPPGKYKLYAGDAKGAESVEIAEGESAARNLKWQEPAP